MALLTTADLIVMLKSNAAPGTPLYAQLDRLRQTVETAVKRYCKWGITANEGQLPGAFFEYYDGKNYPDLVLRKPFVANVSALYLDQFAFSGQNTNNYTPFASTTLQTPGVNYMVNYEQVGLCRAGTITYLGSVVNNAQLWPSTRMWAGPIGINYQPPSGWPQGKGNIKVVYDYGFTPSTAIQLLSYNSGTGLATLQFASPVVTFPGQGFAITGDTSNNWNDEYSVVSVAADYTSLTFRSVNNGAIVGGFADFIPLDIKMAVAEGVSLMRNKIIRGGPVTSESLGDYNYSITLFEHPQWGDVKQLLAGYRDFSQGIANF